LRLKILKKLSTASLNSEFTGYYNKVYPIIILHINHNKTPCEQGCRQKNFQEGGNEKKDQKVVKTTEKEYYYASSRGGGSNGKKD